MTQDQRQSVIVNEEYTPHINRQVVINDWFYSDKASVFNRLGPNSKTYSEVVGKREEYVRQPESQKRINSEVPGPRKRINSSQAITVHTKGSSIKTLQAHAIQSAHKVTIPAKALLASSMSLNTTVKTVGTYKVNNQDKISVVYKTKVTNPSHTIQSTKDHHSQPSSQVKIPFKLIPVVPPKKKVNENAKTENQASTIRNSRGNKVELDLRLEPATRRPLSPVQNSTSSMNATKNHKTFSRQIIQCDARISEPSEDDFTDFKT